MHFRYCGVCEPGEHLRYQGRQVDSSKQDRHTERHSLTLLREDVRLGFHPILGIDKRDVTIRTDGLFLRGDLSIGGRQELHVIEGFPRPHVKL